MKTLMARQLLSLLPKPLRHEVFRRQLSLPQELPPGLIFKIADKEEELLQAFSILHDSYVDAGYMDPDPSGMRVTPYHCVPSTTTLVGKVGGQVVATLSLIRDSGLGVPMDSIFNLALYRANNQRLMEVSSLAIHPDFRGSRGKLFHSFIRYAWHYALQCFGAELFVIAVNPAMAEFYEAFYCFRKIDGQARVDRYSFVKGAPAVGFFVDGWAALDEFRALYAGRNLPTDLHRFMIAPVRKEEVYPERRYFRIDDPVMTQTQLQKLVCDRTGLERNLTSGQRQHLAFVHRGTPLEHIFGGILSGRPLPAEHRYEVSCPVTLLNERMVLSSVAEIRDVSRGGLKLRLEREDARFFARSRRATLRVQIAPSVSSRVEVLPVWEGERGLLGCQVTEASSSWSELLGYLERTAAPLRREAEVRSAA